MNPVASKCECGYIMCKHFSILPEATILWNGGRGGGGGGIKCTLTGLTPLNTHKNLNTDNQYQNIKHFSVFELYF